VSVEREHEHEHSRGMLMLMVVMPSSFVILLVPWASSPRKLCTWNHYASLDNSH